MQYKHTLTTITYYPGNFENPEIETIGQTDDINEIPKFIHDELSLTPIDSKYFTEILPPGPHQICSNYYVIHHVDTTPNYVAT
jgi:hypothetical protein